MTAETGVTTNPQLMVRTPKTYSTRIQTKEGMADFTLVVYVAENHSGELSIARDEVAEWIDLYRVLRWDFDHLLLPNTRDILRDGALALDSNTK